MLTSQMLVNRIIAAGIAHRSEIIGCSSHELDLVAKSAHLPLPEAYRDFLSIVGHGAGSFLQDLDIFYPKMIELTAEAIDILSDWEESKLLLPSLAFVFAMRYGEQFMFFDGNDNVGNPIVYHYLEGCGHFRSIGTFWDVIESELIISEKVRKDNPDFPLLR